MARQLNEHVFDRRARALANGIGIGAAVIVAFGLVFGACAGCRYIIIDTGRAIIQP